MHDTLEDTAHDNVTGMREFADEAGTVWHGSVQERPGNDYKGRYFFHLRSEETQEGVALEDVRWNSERTARRTLETMSEVELRRRLRAARGRG